MDIVAKQALREMVKPGLLVVLMPVVVGYLFKLLYKYGVTNVSGAEVVAGMLLVGTITGVIMALFLNNSGGAWDNAKKYIETGMLGGKGSDAHKAGVVGNTVGERGPQGCGHRRYSRRPVQRHRRPVFARFDKIVIDCNISPCTVVHLI